MSAQFVAHTIFLIVAAAIAFLWTASPTLSALTLQLIAALILLYFAAAWAQHRRHTTRRQVVSIDLTILTITILLLIASTGGLSSPIFFATYFLLFAVALLFETEATLVLTGVLFVFLTLLPSTNLADITHLAELISVVMITPLAIFTGHQHELILESKKSEKALNNHLKQEESDTLLFLSLNLKNTLVQALDTLSILIPTQKNIDSKNHLTRLYQDLRALYKTSKELSVSIDKQTD